jgi:chromate transport protein ChrA
VKDVFQINLGALNVEIIQKYRKSLHLSRSDLVLCIISLFALAAMQIACVTPLILNITIPIGMLVSTEIKPQKKQYIKRADVGIVSLMILMKSITATTMRISDEN